MTRLARVEHAFVEYIPEHLERGTLYISIPYATVVHSCFCGCGSEVVTPISPVGWSVTFHGNSVSLDPSVGSWELPCKSHYWIKENHVEWHGQWSEARIAKGRAKDRQLLTKHFDSVVSTNEGERGSASVATQKTETLGLWARLKHYFIRVQ